MNLFQKSHHVQDENICYPYEKHMNVVNKVKHMAHFGEL